jgi:glycosyltransferase involved in cell wall biosynthesis
MDDNHLLEICEKFNKRLSPHPNIRYMPIFQKGIAYARNEIVKVIDSDIIVNFDADAVFDRPDALEYMIHPILNKEAKLTNCECILFDFKNKKAVTQTPKNPNIYEIASNIGTSLERYIFARGPGLTVDKEAFFQVGGFRDVSVAEDYWLSVDVCMEYSYKAKKFIDDVKVLVSDRRAQSFDKHGFDVFNYDVHSFR